MPIPEEIASKQNGVKAEVIMARNQSRERRVALLIASATAHGRGILLGITRYARSLGHWASFIHSRGAGPLLPPWLAGWRGCVRWWPPAMGTEPKN